MEFYPNSYSAQPDTIEKACALYDAVPVKRGYTVTAGGDVPGYETPGAGQPAYMVWTPSLDSDRWMNRLSADGTVMAEQATDPERNRVHLDNIRHEADRLRITFLRDARGDVFRFVGVFRIDDACSEAAGMRIYRRVSDVMPALVKKARR